MADPVAPGGVVRSGAADRPLPPPDDDAGTRAGRPRDPALDQAIIEATRRRLAQDGYANMTIGDIAADAGVSRPSIYRRWPGKLELAADAMRYGFEAFMRTQPIPDLDELPAREAFAAAVRWIDPRAVNPDAMVFIGDLMGESFRTPELLELLRQHGTEPRMRAFEQVLVDLQRRGAVRDEVDVRTVATLCLGAYCATFLRTVPDETVADAVVDALWPGLATKPD